MIAEIDSRAQDVLDFWFGAIWWKKRAFDALLTERFGALLDEALSGGLTQ